MSKVLCIYSIAVIFVLYWNTILLVQIGQKSYYVPVYSDVCYLLNIQKVPVFSVLRKRQTSGFTSSTTSFTLENCQETSATGDYSLLERPVVGDHIHLGMVLSVNGQVMNFHDRNMSQPIPYEDDAYPVTCSNRGTHAYEKRWYHTGVHTHCDGNIVHVHPWSAPAELRVEGRRVRLKLWFESVGIEVSSDRKGLKMPGSDEYIYQWTMYYYVNVNDKHPAMRTHSVEEICNLWLVDHHGLILLWSGSKRPARSTSVLQYKSHPKDYPKRKVSY